MRRQGRAAQLPHHGDMVRELALEPRGGDEQFRPSGLLAKGARCLRELGGGADLVITASSTAVGGISGARPGAHDTFGMLRNQITDFGTSWCSRRVWLLVQSGNLSNVRSAPLLVLLLEFLENRPFQNMIGCIAS
jgi:hypothetical protein